MKTPNKKSKHRRSPSVNDESEQEPTKYSSGRGKGRRLVPASKRRRSPSLDEESEQEPTKYSGGRGKGRRLVPASKRC